MLIRRAAMSDLAAITDIYAEAVLNGTGSFEIAPPDIEEMKRRHAAGGGLNRDSFLVAETADGVAGYAYYAPYHTRPAYAATVETSVYVRPALHKRGIGRALLAALISHAERDGKRQMIAVIGDSGNTGSTALHEALGFVRVGVLDAVGYKHDRWLDCVIMQRALGDGAASPPLFAAKAVAE